MYRVLDQGYSDTYLYQTETTETNMATMFSLWLAYKRKDISRWRSHLLTFLSSAGFHVHIMPQHYIIGIQQNVPVSNISRVIIAIKYTTAYVK